VVTDVVRKLAGVGHADRHATTDGDIKAGLRERGVARNRNARDDEWNRRAL
jgi:hypothetical protein